MKAHYEKGGLGDVAVKRYLNEVLQNLLAPIRARREKLKENIDDVYKVACEGTEKAKLITENTLKKVKKAMKIDYHSLLSK